MSLSSKYWPCDDRTASARISLAYHRPASPTPSPLPACSAGAFSRGVQQEVFSRGGAAGRGSRGRWGLRNSHRHALRTIQPCSASIIYCSTAPVIYISYSSSLVGNRQGPTLNIGIKSMATQTKHGSFHVELPKFSISSLKRALSVAVQRFRLSRKAARDARLLMSYDDRQLADIGITRGEIERMVKRNRSIWH